MIRGFVIIAALLFFAVANPMMGAEVGFYFSGAVANVFQDPFHAQLTASPTTTVAGRVLYDSNSLPSDPMAGCDCMGYRQHIVGGFTAMFGNTSVRADDYVVQVKNNLTQPAAGPLDTLSVRFSSGFSPPLASPLW